MAKKNNKQKKNGYKIPLGIPDIGALRTRAQARRSALDQAGLSTYEIGTKNKQVAIMCLCCGFGSVNPMDIENRFCGFCNAFHEESIGVTVSDLLPEDYELQCVRDLLSLVGVELAVEDMAAWSAVQVEEACSWAAFTYIAANDNTGIKVPERPSFLK